MGGPKAASAALLRVQTNAHVHMGNAEPFKLIIGKAPAISTRSIFRALKLQTPLRRIVWRRVVAVVEAEVVHRNAGYIAVLAVPDKHRFVRNGLHDDGLFAVYSGDGYCGIRFFRRNMRAVEHHDRSANFDDAFGKLDVMAAHCAVVHLREHVVESGRVRSADRLTLVSAYRDTLRCNADGAALAIDARRGAKGHSQTFDN